jgi:hypothetical protein
VADSKQLKILRKGKKAWNASRPVRDKALPPGFLGADLSGADLRAVDLSGADLSGADLSRANLSEAELSGADLSGADLSGANLREANLGRASLDEADLTGADLTGANFSGANLSGANLSGANLAAANLGGVFLTFAMFHETTVSGADFSDAKIWASAFADVDLSVAKGLEVVIHGGPSTIGIDTIYRSGGNIPEVFLRGCGVPEDFITYAKSLVGKAIEYYSCFISYSTLDQEFAERLHADLQAKNVRCWYAPHDIQGGKKTHEQIDAAILSYDKLLLIVSNNSMNSEWVKTEISKARKREASENRRMLFPIRLVDFKKISAWEFFDADRGKDSAREIREFYIPDFSTWKTDHDKYKEEFTKLLTALNKP